MQRPKLAIVIPAYLGIKQLEQCLSALGKSEYQDFSIVVVDHGETDAISRFVVNNFPEVVCLRGSAALWWSGATNLGIKHAIENNSELVMLLNHDCFVRPNTIGLLLATSELTDNEIVAPVQNNLITGKKIVKAYSCMLLGFPTILPPSPWPGPIKRGTVVETNLIVGGRGVIIPSKVFRHIGLFDEKHLPHYGADHDFYFRCRDNGIKLYVVCNSIVDVDSTSSSMAEQAGDQSFAKFIQTLKSTRSHRNIRDLSMLFKRHYPVKWLWGIGVALNSLRYFFSYIWHRIFR